MYSELQDKIVVIGGASGALGVSVARRFQQEGARLVLLDRNAEALGRVTAQLGLREERAMTHATDLTQHDAVEAAIAGVITRFDRIDVVVSVAGGFRFSGPMYQADPTDLDALFTINVKTAALLSAAALKQMVTMGTRGSIILVGARPALTGAANIAAYAASKAAVVSLMESMAIEVLEQKITVNAILPSTIDTPANRQAMPDNDFERWVKPESLADVIAFLASDSARDISGAALPVYGRA